jgi:hypothetical protein
LEQKQSGQAQVKPQKVHPHQPQAGAPAAGDGQSRQAAEREQGRQGLQAPLALQQQAQHLQKVIGKHRRRHPQLQPGRLKAPGRDQQGPEGKKAQRGLPGGGCHQEGTSKREPGGLHPGQLWRRGHPRPGEGEGQSRASEKDGGILQRLWMRHHQALGGEQSHHQQHRPHREQHRPANPLQSHVALQQAKALIFE